MRVTIMNDECNVKSMANIVKGAKAFAIETGKTVEIALFPGGDDMYYDGTMITIYIDNDRIDCIRKHPWCVRERIHYLVNANANPKNILGVDK